MQMCQPHWDELKQEVIDRGLGALIPGNAEEAAERMKHQLAGKDCLVGFDPLMGAYWSIVSFLASMSTSLMFIEGCPVCAADQSHQEMCRDMSHEKPCKETFGKYFKNAVNDQVNRYLELKS